MYTERFNGRNVIAVCNGHIYESALDVNVIYGLINSRIQNMKMQIICTPFSTFTFVIM